MIPNALNRHLQITSKAPKKYLKNLNRPLTGLDNIVASTPLSTLKAYVSVRYLLANVQLLPRAYRVALWDLQPRGFGLPPHVPSAVNASSKLADIESASRHDTCMASLDVRNIYTHIYRHNT
jgi:hypothetical protein